MKQQDYTTSIVVDQPAGEVFRAISNVRGWWSEGVEGDTENLNDEFVYRHKDMHYSKQRLVEVVPGKKLVWLVTDSKLSFIKGNQSEWTGTRVSFDIAPKGNKTEILFTHNGLVPDIECFIACSRGWNYYLYNSLAKLITTGKGEPDPKEN
jgi:activator of Hsp90 ATPase-like protein